MPFILPGSCAGHTAVILPLSLPRIDKALAGFVDGMGLEGGRNGVGS